jgi:hypothetical protein
MPGPVSCFAVASALHKWWVTRLTLAKDIVALEQQLGFE